jgi:hypothetical protein
MAVWACARLMPPADFAVLRARHHPHEEDPVVAATWDEGA